MIEIGPSRILRLCIALIWGAGTLMLALQPLIWIEAAHVLWTAAIAYWVITTCGLNGRKMALLTDKSGTSIVVDGHAIPVNAIRPGIVSRSLATFELETAETSFAVMAGNDNVSGKDHWRLRRLLLEYR